MGVDDDHATEVRLNCPHCGHPLSPGLSEDLSIECATCGFTGNWTAGPICPICVGQMIGGFDDQPIYDCPFCGAGGEHELSINGEDRLAERPRWVFFHYERRPGRPLPVGSTEEIGKAIVLGLERVRQQVDTSVQNPDDRDEIRRELDKVKAFVEDYAPDMTEIARIRDYGQRIRNLEDRLSQVEGNHRFAVQETYQRESVHLSKRAVILAAIALVVSSVLSLVSLLKSPLVSLLKSLGVF